MGKPAGAGVSRATWLMRPSEVADVFRVDRRTVIRWVESGRLTSVRTRGKQHRFSSNEVISLLVADGLKEAEAVELVESSRQPKETIRGKF